ncbi:NADH:flavin oxidoreductase [Brevibacterium daeguense]|uniref:NADH:flavin oxidoreductase n=1 Tax=Brevibacterium daeguense TaxID=909936 RepID=A0ABP8EI90_9MICO|nr:FAD-dependent oxidoreductase [Brevibacterium daeguense]
MKADPLLQPYRLGPLTLRNRIISTSHEPAYTEDGMPKDRYRLYHLEKARGGVGMTMIGGSAIVSPDSPAAFGNIDLSTDEVVPWLAKLTDDCHTLGTAVTIQVTHLGARTTSYAGDWLPTVSPSRYREPAHRSFTKAAEDFDIERIVADYAAAARRVAAAGLDGLELQHYGHLLDSFVTPWLNHRDDEFGGSLENRLRFPLMVIDAVRAAVPDDFLVGIRMSVDEHRPDGITEADAVEILKIYAAHGIDFLSLTAGTIESDRTLAATIPGMGTPSAPFLDACKRVRAQIPIPVLHATRIADVPTARHAIADGCVDLIGMTRAQLADPYLVDKIASGQEDDIRPCVGANLCLDGIYASGSATCIHNPATGREQTLPQVLPVAGAGAATRRVVVVGAGPAGLEAARVCGVYGHDVTVLEAAATYGGQVQLAARSPRRRDLIGIVDWRYQQALKHGVKFRFNSLADEALVRGLSPDVVIVATGGMPDSEVGAGGRFVHDVWDVMTDQVPPGRVLVYDDHGLYPALDAVERLAERGSEVVYVTPERMIGIDVGAMNSPAYLEAFGRHGVQVRLTERVTEVARGGRSGPLRVTVRNEYTDAETELEVDAVVVDHGTVPNDELYFALKEASANRGFVELEKLLRPLAYARGSAGVEDPATQRAPATAAAEAESSAATAAVPAGASSAESEFQLFRIGDAVSSRNIHAAVLDALRIGLLV